MEFELGQTYSGYKFLDVVTRSRGAVQYRVQNTLAQRVESLRTPAPAPRRTPRHPLLGRGAHPPPPLAPAHRYVLHGRSHRGTHGDDHGDGGLASAGRAPETWPAALARSPRRHPPVVGSSRLHSPAVLCALRHHAREHPGGPWRLLQTGGFL